MATKKTPKKAAPKPKRPRAVGNLSWKDGFIAALRNCGNVRAACQACQVGRQTVYDEKANDPAFAKRWELAVEEAVEVLEAMARQRAMKSSDLLLIFLLKALKPDVYREVRDVNVKGNLNQEIVVDLVSRTSDDE